MSRENVDLVRRVHEAFNAEGMGAVLPFLSHEVEWHDIPDQPDAVGVGRGHEGALRVARPTTANRSSWLNATGVVARRAAWRFRTTWLRYGRCRTG